MSRGYDSSSSRYERYVCGWIIRLPIACWVSDAGGSDGLELVWNLGCNAVQAESDAVKVVNACNGEDMWWISAAVVYAECLI
jgi:hypothetical protein